MSSCEGSYDNMQSDKNKEHSFGTYDDYQVDNSMKWDLVSHCTGAFSCFNLYHQILIEWRLTHKTMIELIKEKYQYNTDALGNDLGISLASYGKLELLKQCVKLGLCDLKHKNNQGKTALAVAKSCGEKEIVDFLENVKVKDDVGDIFFKNLESSANFDGDYDELNVDDDENLI